MALADDLDRLYDDCIPPDLGAEFLRLLSKHFADTPDFVESYWHAPEARDLLGHIRRANFEQDWRSLGERTVGVVITAFPCSGVGAFNLFG